MKKRTLTAEQTAARDARRAKFAGLAKQVSAMTPDQRCALAASMGAVVTIEGRALSPFNSCLVLLQACGRPVTMVGGFRQWIKHDRAVRKGEHGFSIWVPIGSKASEGSEPGGDGERTHFTSGTVFDVSQTQELGAESPVAIVSPEIADAFGMRALPNVIVDESDDEKRFEPDPSAKFQFGGFINNPVDPRKAATTAEHCEQAELLTLEN